MMKRVLVGAVCCFLLYSCGNNEQNKSVVDQPENKEMDIDQLAGKLHGLWISEPYLENIEAKKSVYQSRKYSTKILGFNLDKKTLVTDSAMLEGFTDHEGGYSSPLKFDGHTFVNNIAKLSEFAYFKEPFDLNFDGKNKLEMVFPKSNEKDVYRKAKADFATEIRDILIAGKYSMGKTKVKLDSDGGVHNFQGFNYYNIICDFGEGIEYDAIIFFKSLESELWTEGELYAFKWVGNTLELQHVKTNWDTMDHKIESKVLRLEKQ